MSGNLVAPSVSAETFRARNCVPAFPRKSRFRGAEGRSPAGHPAYWSVWCGAGQAQLEQSSVLLGPQSCLGLSPAWASVLLGPQSCLGLSPAWASVLLGGVL